IEEVRGVGLMLGLKINEKIPNSDLTQKLIELGLLVIPASDNVIRIMPPLIITQSHIKEAAEKISQCFIKYKGC
ncbi:MAG: aminotransferase class III-fold pyridoxal phosphate-dependent enzyme, partial [Alphaproteobacteria bacterium]|nr:aminotransferase class III-fold pyridoxal phosphate-dependent enzyme [Alphaproteobacteria bacterium]